MSTTPFHIPSSKILILTRESSICHTKPGNVRREFGGKNSGKTLSLKDVTVIVPIHNDLEHLDRLHEDLQAYPELEIVVVSSAGTRISQRIVEELQVIVSDQLGRGVQIALGVMQSTRRWIWILHADSRVTRMNVGELERAIAQCRWGRFDVRLDGNRPAYRVIEWFMNVRSVLTGICTGDQGIFVQRSLLQEIGGMPKQPLMEDIELCKQLRSIEKPLRIRTQLQTSVRKWEREGILATVARMWAFRWRYFLGTNPDFLYQDYYDREGTK